jgi:tetratricopeptide (TPR) repeat protein
MQIPEIDQAAAIDSGWAACKASRFREAESWFNGLIDESGAGPTGAVCGLSAVKRALGRPAAAKRVIERARQYRTGDPSLSRELGYIAYDRRDFEAAADIFAGLAKRHPCSVEDLRWLAASLRMAGDYHSAQDVLDDASKRMPGNCYLDIELGWVAYGRHEFKLAAEHFRAAQAHGAPHDLFVPPLVTVLLRLNRPDAAEEARDVAGEAAAYGRTSPIACAQADIHVHNGYPEKAIALLRERVAMLDDHGIRQLITLLIGADRRDEAPKVFREWLQARYGTADYPLEFAPPPVVATSIDVAGKELAGHRHGKELIAKVHARLDLYQWPDFAPAVVAASAICALRTADKNEAMKIVRKSAAQHLEEPGLLIESAKTSFVCRDYHKACEILDRVIRREPDNDRALQWLCRSMHRLGQWAELEKRLAQEIKSHGQSARLQIELGWLLVVKGDYPRAREAFSEALRLDKSSQQALFGLITALRKMQRWDEVSAKLAKWRNQWPHSKRRLLAEAMIALARDDLRRAMTLFQKMDSVAGLLGQASVLTRQRDTGKAIAIAEKAYDLDRDRPGAKIALAMRLVQRAEGRDQGNERLRKLSEADRARASDLCEDAMEWGAESDAAARAYQAHLALGRGHRHAAESLLREALQHNPHCDLITSALANVLIGMHRVDDAVKMLKEHISKYGPQASTQFQLHRALAARGDSEDALAALWTAFGLATEPESDTLAVALAYELEQQKCPAEAEGLLRDRLNARNMASDDQLRLGLAWILLSRGDKDRSPALLQDAAAEATRVIEHPDPRPVGGHPEKIRDEALKCRGTAYYKLAEHARNPRDKSYYAAAARHDQREGDIARGKVPRGARMLARLAAGLDVEFRTFTLAVALTFTAALWALHANNQSVWTTPMVMSLTPLFIAAVLLTALLPQLQSLKLAGLEAQTREPPDVPLPTSPSVVLPLVTEFAAVAHESFLDAVDVSDLVGSSSTPLQAREQGTPSQLGGPGTPIQVRGPGTPIQVRGRSMSRRLEPHVRGPDRLARSG